MIRCVLGLLALLGLAGCVATEADSIPMKKEEMRVFLVPSAPGDPAQSVDPRLLAAVALVIEQPPIKRNVVVPAIPRWRFEFKDKRYKVLRGTIWREEDQAMWPYDGNPLLQRMSTVSDHFFFIQKELDFVLNGSDSPFGE